MADATLMMLPPMPFRCYAPIRRRLTPERLSLSDDAIATIRDAAIRR